MSHTIPTRPGATSVRAHITIVASRYNDEFVGPMLEATKKEISEIAPNITLSVIRVPGAFEVPVTVKMALDQEKPEAVVALGLILRGHTQHADLVAASVTDALQKLAINYGVPVIHEVLLVDDEEQAAERCKGTDINRGTEAARVAVQMVSLFQKLKSNA
jgi:6,7-dimethyl-8-ribityllumazine synthase